MTAHITESNSLQVVPAPPKSGESKPHVGAVARLLARFAKWSADYAEYQMEHVEERKMVI